MRLHSEKWFSTCKEVLERQKTTKTCCVFFNDDYDLCQKRKSNSGIFLYLRVEICFFHFLSLRKKSRTLLWFNSCFYLEFYLRISFVILACLQRGCHYLFFALFSRAHAQTVRQLLGASAVLICDPIKPPTSGRCN